jgi:hypothetical protein
MKINLAIILSLLSEASALKVQPIATNQLDASTTAGVDIMSNGTIIDVKSFEKADSQELMHKSDDAKSAKEKVAYLKNIDNTLKTELKAEENRAEKLSNDAYNKKVAEKEAKDA